MENLTILKPFDAHLHARYGEMAKLVVPFTTRTFRGAVFMGNLPQPVENAATVTNYRYEIESLIDPQKFDAIFTVMLTRGMTPEIIREAFNAGAKVLKLIPGGTSTGSSQGVSLPDLKNYYPVLAVAQELGMVFSGHWELINFPDATEDIHELEREAAAIPYLEDVINNFPDLKIVAEHISTRALLEAVTNSPESVVGTITVHHLVLNKDEVFSSDHQKIVNPHHYCKPVAKTHEDREVLIKAATSGNPRFFFGSDSAPHLRSAKESEKPAAGIFTAPVALPLLTQIFAEANALDKLENFVSVFGPRFYDLPDTQETITLAQEDWLVEDLKLEIEIFQAGKTLKWKVA